MDAGFGIYMALGAEDADGVLVGFTSIIYSIPSHGRPQACAVILEDLFTAEAARNTPAQAAPLLKQLAKAAKAKRLRIKYIG